MSLQNTLLEIERSLWRSNAHAYRARVLDTALFVFPETGAIGKSDAVEGIEQSAAQGRGWVDVDLSDIRFVETSAGVAVLTYRASAKRASDSKPLTLLASSLYVQGDDDWKLAFHQQSPLSNDCGPNGAAPNGAGSTPETLARQEAAVPARSLGALAVGAAAYGAFAIGMSAIGAMAIGAMAIGALAVKRGRVHSLTIDALEIGTLHVDHLDTFHNLSDRAAEGRG